MKKFALVNFGNEESYGLLFAGTEFKKHGEIKFFDAELNPTLVKDIVSYDPDYICFSPMTTFYPLAKFIESQVKYFIDPISIYGGHHASNCGHPCGDITVIGSVSNINLSNTGIINNGITKPEELKVPAREEYYRDIPRMKTRYRKVMLSVTGCPWSCTYCSSSNKVTTSLYGSTKCHLTHRSIPDIISEAKFIKDHTHEIEWVDDDIFFGKHDWLNNFILEWHKEINIPMYVSTTSINALRAKPKLLKNLRRTVNCIGLGVQAINPDSLKLLGRSWDNEKQIKEAYDYLKSFGFNVNLQCIVGLPVIDPVEDAMETIDGLKRIGSGSVISCYPLQIYPNTDMERYCTNNLYPINEFANGDTNSGLPGIDFGEKVNNRIRNVCKLATMVVKYNIDTRWLASMLDIDLGGSSKSLSLIRYYECIKDRLPNKADKLFNEIIGSMNVRF